MTIRMRTRFSRLTAEFSDTYRHPVRPQLNQHAFWPQPLRLLPKPTVRTAQTVAKPARMDKFTSIEKRLLDKTTHILAKSSGEYGYMLKLVKRGYFKATDTATKHEARFTITPAGERARAGMSLLKAVQGKQGIASGATFGHAVETATA